MKNSFRFVDDMFLLARKYRSLHTFNRCQGLDRTETKVRLFGTRNKRMKEMKERRAVAETKRTRKYRGEEVNAATATAAVAAAAAAAAM